MPPVYRPTPQRQLGARQPYLYVWLRRLWPQRVQMSPSLSPAPRWVMLGRGVPESTACGGAPLRCAPAGDSVAPLPGFPSNEGRAETSSGGPPLIFSVLSTRVGHSSTFLRVITSPVRLDRGGDA